MKLVVENTFQNHEAKIIELFISYYYYYICLFIINSMFSTSMMPTHIFVFFSLIFSHLVICHEIDLYEKTER